MDRKGNLIKNTFILSIGTFFPRFVTVLVTPILTAQLTKAEMGQYDLVTTIVSLLFPAVTLQISAAAFRFLINTRKKKEESTVIISTIYAFVLIASLLPSIIFLLFFRNKVGDNGLLVCAYFFADILFVTTTQMMRGLGKNLMYSISSLIRAIVDVGLLALLTGVFGTVNLGIRGTLIAMLVSTVLPLVFLLTIGGIIPYIKFSHVSKTKLRELLSYSWPMVPNNLSGWVLKLSDRLVITAVCGIEMNAIYAVACKVTTVLSYFQSTFMQAWQENSSLALNDSDKDQYFSQMCDWIYRLLFGALATLICATPLLWMLLVHGDYDQAYYQLPILYLGVLFSCMASILGAIYTAHMRSKSVGITTSIAAVINIVIDLCMVWKCGIWAGSVSTLVSYLFLFLYRMKDIQKFQPIHFEKKRLIIGFVALTVMGALCFLKNTISNIANVPICIFVIVYFDKDIIASLFRMIRRKTKRKTEKSKVCEERGAEK